MSNGQLFIVAVVIGAALLALWVDVRYPSLAPGSLIRRFVALAVACVLLQAVPPVVVRLLALPLGSNAPALLGSAALLIGLTFGFLTAVWLLRSLQGLGAMR